MTASNDKLHRELGEQGQRLEVLERGLEENTDKLDELVKWKNQRRVSRRPISHTPKGLSVLKTILEVLCAAMFIQVHDTIYSIRVFGAGGLAMALPHPL